MKTVVVSRWDRVHSVYVMRSKGEHPSGERETVLVTQLFIKTNMSVCMFIILDSLYAKILLYIERDTDLSDKE